MTAYFIGMGISAFVPSVLSLVQGAGATECPAPNASLPANATVYPLQTPPLFPVSTFFALTAAWTGAALAAFVALVARDDGLAQKETPSLPPATLAFHPPPCLRAREGVAGRDEGEPDEATPVAVGMKPRPYSDEGDVEVKGTSPVPAPVHFLRLLHLHSCLGFL